MRRRVVVTGIGIVCPLGLTIADTWKNILQGKSGIQNITDFDTTDFNCKFAGLVNNFNTDGYLEPKDAQKCDLFVRYGIVAGMQAIIDADLTNVNRDRVGLVIGSGIGGIGTIEHNHKSFTQGGPRRISPFFIPGAIINMIAGNLSIKYGFRGPNIAVATACTTGTHAIGLGMRSILYNEADVIIAGGAEKASTPLGMGGFAAARALSTRNHDPEKASRPWDIGRDGFVLGDGAGIVVLEEYEHAKKRNANIYAEVVGFGMSGDAFHITRPSGDGAVLAMERALMDAQINKNELGYINAHGTSTPIGDVEESKAIKKVFGEHAYKLLISSTKSMTGHLLGAAGAVEAIFTILALRDQVAPPTINLEEPDPECDLNYVPLVAQSHSMYYALSNSFGFGGTNASLVFGSLT